MCKKNGESLLFQEKILFTANPGQLRTSKPLANDKTRCAGCQSFRSVLPVLVKPVNENRLVEPVQAVGDQAQAEHEENQADDSKREGPEHETYRAQSGVGNAKGSAVILLFDTLQGDNPQIKLQHDDNERNHDKTLDVYIHLILPIFTK
jgi:hypothetical protein